jgi:putative hydrolases of HD superfamily
LEKTLKMIIVHDLVEIFAGDVPAFEVESMEAKQKKQQAEAEYMERMQSQLPSPLKEEIPALWHEFEQRQTPEALFAHTLDKLEAQLQHNEADISTWLPIEKERVFYKFEDLGEIDPFLSSCVLFVKEEALQKMQKAGCNLIELQQLSMRSP